MEFPLFLKYFLVATFILLLNQAMAGEDDPLSGSYGDEKVSLDALKATFNDPFLNKNWTGLQCSVNTSAPWHGIKCFNDHVTEISLKNMDLTGDVMIDALVNLTELSVLSFKNNTISGYVMNFSANRKLRRLDLSGNLFYGPISESLLSLDVLESLQLQDNFLSGPILEFNQNSIREFNVSNNNLEGTIPLTQVLQSFGFASYSGNPDLCGPPSFSACKHIRIEQTANSSTSGFCDPSTNSTCNSTNDKTDKSNKDSFKNKFSVIFLLVDVVGLIAVILLFIHYYKKSGMLKKMIRKRTNEEAEEADNFKVEMKIEGGERRLSVEAGDRRALVPGEQPGKFIFLEDEARFQLDDLLKASAEGLGKGTFGNSYKAILNDEKSIVVKRLTDLKPLSNEEFTKQLQIIAGLKHPNLLPLLAYYYSNEEKLLAYNFARNGNLFKRLHGARGIDRIPFRWGARLSVARGVARALEYLHHNSNSECSVPHGNLKPSNVLLDQNNMVLVSDYCLTSLISLPIAAQQMIAFKSPEYQNSRKLSWRSDVWSYGYLLLELLTGRISVHSAPPGVNGVDLGSWVHRAIREEWTGEIFDSEICVQRSATHGMLRLLQIAIRCSDKSPEKRPEMSEVVREVDNINFNIESEEEDDISLDRSLTDDSMSTTASGIVGDL